MKIALCLDDTLDSPDGVQQYVLTLGAWLTSRGHIVSYVAGPSKRKDLKHLYALGSTYQTHFNGNVVRTPLPVLRSQIAVALEKIQPDVIHVQMPYSPFLAGRVIQQASETTAVVGTFHILPQKSWQTPVNRALAAIERTTLRRFNLVMAVSEPAAQFASAAYGLHPVVVPNAVSVNSFTGHTPVRFGDQGKLAVLFLGRLVTRKGVLELIRAYKQLDPHTRSNTQLVICSKGELEQKARQLAYGDADIHFTGYIEEKDKPAVLAGADIAVFPSTGGESFGIVLIEAIASGAGMVLAGNNPGYSSVLCQTPEALVDPKDTGAFARTLEHFIVSQKARTGLIEKQRRLIKAFDIETVGPKIVEIYGRAMKSRP